MLNEYKPQIIEKKWQDIWANTNAFRASDDSDKPKCYLLVEFPYPSGSGLHVGHIRAYTSLEVIARKRRMEGYNVLFPIGWDAFGLPTENYAIQTGVHPRIVTDQNIAVFTQQLKDAGYSFDWERTVDTTDPNYYKWTQWVFLQLFKHGLAYKNTTFVNFCTQCKVVLANEESPGGVCDRCGSDVIQMEKDVWFLKIKSYAQKLLDELPALNYLPRVKTEQENWIGRSEGAQIKFPVKNTKDVLEVFTTRPDTLYGATFMVIAPEHPLIETHKNSISNLDEVYQYQNDAKKKSEFERVQLSKEKTGVPLQGLQAINPVTNQPIPIWIADYVMMGYGTGAIMAVPAHDNRDWEFATKFDIPIIEVIQGGDIKKEAFVDTENGILVNSGFLNGQKVPNAIKNMIKYLEQNGVGERKINYKMKDWAFNRQRYWGEPIPIIHCPDCGLVPVPEEDLPLLLPEVDNYKPTETGESPLAAMDEWINVPCPCCGKPAKRETDTMPQWAGSSWYFLRYMDPQNSTQLASKENMSYWGPVDWYNGGMEHVTRHLIYSRFWHRFLFDIGVIPYKEPYAKRTTQGLVLGDDGEKMSKSRGNVINPNAIIEQYGADTLRCYILFIGDYEKPAIWSDNSVKGCKRFLDRVWKLQDMIIPSLEYDKKHITLMHKTISKVSQDYENMKYNTAIAAMMSAINVFYEDGFLTKAEFRDFIALLNPITPHISEELWSLQDFNDSVSHFPWPTWDNSKTIEDIVELPVQINGKMKGKIQVSRVASLEEVKQTLHSNDKLASMIHDKTLIKEIYVPGTILNLVIK